MGAGYRCVAMDSIIRIVGAISLWSVEIIMQLRVYAIYKCSKRVRHTSSLLLPSMMMICRLCQVVIFNFVLFLGSIAGFMYVLVYNAERRRAVIAQAVTLPLPGCPSIHSGIEWAQWVPGKCLYSDCPSDLSLLLTQYVLCECSYGVRRRSVLFCALQDREVHCRESEK